MRSFILLLCLAISSVMNAQVKQQFGLQGNYNHTYRSDFNYNAFGLLYERSLLSQKMSMLVSFDIGKGNKDVKYTAFSTEMPMNPIMVKGNTAFRFNTFMLGIKQYAVGNLEKGGAYIVGGVGFISSEHKYKMESYEKDQYFLGFDPVRAEGFTSIYFQLRTGFDIAIGKRIALFAEGVGYFARPGLNNEHYSPESMNFSSLGVNGGVKVRIGK